MLACALVSALGRSGSEWVDRITDHANEQLGAKLPRLVGLPPVDAAVDVDGTVFLLAKPDYEFPLPAAISSHLGPFKRRRYEDATAAGGWRDVFSNGRPVFDAANGMSNAILRWNDGFWLVSPASALFNESRAHLNIKDDALAPWDVGHPSWAM